MIKIVFPLVSDLQDAEQDMHYPTANKVLDRKGLQNENPIHLLANQKNVYCREVEFIIKWHSRQSLVCGMHPSIKLSPVSTSQPSFRYFYKHTMTVFPLY